MSRALPKKAATATTLGRSARDSTGCSALGIADFQVVQACDGCVAFEDGQGDGLERGGGSFTAEEGFAQSEQCTTQGWSLCAFIGDRERLRELIARPLASRTVSMPCSTIGKFTLTNHAADDRELPAILLAEDRIIGWK